MTAEELRMRDLEAEVNRLERVQYQLREIIRIKDEALAAALNAQAGVVEALRFCMGVLGEFATDQCPEGWRAIEAYQTAERALAAVKGVEG